MVILWRTLKCLLLSVLFWFLPSTGEENPLKPVALASFPGSGNTWLRYLLQQVTGILTGSVYSDYDLMMTSFPAEGVHNSSVLVVKTHEHGPLVWGQFRRAVLLVRDPQGAILAEFNRQNAGHLGIASEDLFYEKSWEEFVRNKLISWTDFHLDWTRNFLQPIEIVFYEDLVSDLRGSLVRILRFLQWPVDDKNLDCAIKRRRGNYKRRQLPFDPFTKSMKDRIDETRNNTFKELKRMERVRKIYFTLFRFL
ncbi:WSCD family member AAEL009094-like [Phlebotomus argentipes]|uniref:WSCD family member AAEL009094-like n=1 Tax=Phlebotomus argentipes TaxID=94469 RepID=UPI002893229A|nr:WSCD family member AAEL009094-like [Phlebotomus argentipes]